MANARRPVLAATHAASAHPASGLLSNASEPQGTLNASTLANAAGVEGSLIAGYRTLDCTDATNGNWGCAASNWVFGGVASDEAYKGSSPLDQPPINDIEGFHWGTGSAAEYLDVKWQQSYEGVVRANSTIRLLKQVVASNPSEISLVDQHGIEGEATFLRAHYHFEAYRMWGQHATILIRYGRPPGRFFALPARRRWSRSMRTAWPAGAARSAS